MTARVLKLDARLDLGAVNGLAEALRARQGGDLVLDAGDVIQIGALAVQTLRAAARSWAETGHELRLENLPDGAAADLALLGFTPEAVTRWMAPS